MHHTPTTRRAADQKCPTCGATAQVTECTTTRPVGGWVARTEVQVDRTFHCAGHVALQREYTVRPS